ncbi:MAG: hypothetical protein WB767_15800 [Nocardioides sp.]
MQPDKSAEVERFSPTHGRVLGTVMLVLCLVVSLTAVLDRDGGIDSVPWWLVALMAFIATLAWASMLRPGLAIAGESLVMRNMLETVTIPLAGIEEIASRQVLAVRVGEKKFLCSAISRSRRELNPRTRPTRDVFTNVALPSGTAGGMEASYAVLVENRVRAAAKEARDQRGLAIRSDAQAELLAEVVRRPAWVEIVLLVGSFVAFVLAAFV